MDLKFYMDGQKKSCSGKTLRGIRGAVLLAGYSECRNGYAICVV